MCKGGKSVKSYIADSDNSGEAKMDSCKTLPKTQWIKGCRFYGSYISQTEEGHVQEIPSCMLCKPKYYRELEFDTKRWICDDVTEDTEMNLKCAPGKPNRGTIAGTCKQCNTARDYWPKDTTIVSASEFDQTCE
jgi:hypothetical protein